MCTNFLHCPSPSSLDTTTLRFLFEAKSSFHPIPQFWSLYFATGLCGIQKTLEPNCVSEIMIPFQMADLMSHNSVTTTDDLKPLKIAVPMIVIQTLLCWTPVHKTHYSSPPHPRAGATNTFCPLPPNCRFGKSHCWGKPQSGG